MPQPATLFFSDHSGDPAAMATQAEVMAVIRKFLASRQLDSPDLGPSTELYHEGLGLESLDAAELSALLEENFGTDPYSQGELPETIGDIVRFYES